jgi:hypothetical protein
MSVAVSRFGVTAVLMLVCGASVAAEPSITSFTPKRAHLGDHVVITGTGFTGTHHVTIGGTSAHFKLVSPTQISATIPATASGPIDITTQTGSVSTGNATVTILPSVVLSAGTVQPGTTITLTGAGFPAYSTIDVYIDATDEALTVTNNAGVFTGTLPVPSSTQPGPHWVTLDQRGQHYGAQALLTIDTDWVQNGFNASGQNDNPFENTLTDRTVGQLSPVWLSNSSQYANAQPLAIAGGVTFVADEEGNAHAYSPSGALLWTASLGAAIIVPVDPVVSGNLVIFADSTALSAYHVNCGTGGATCKPAWTKTLPVAVTAGLSLHNGTIYVPGADGQVRPVNPTTGAVGTPFYAYTTTQGAVTTPVHFSLDGSYFYGTATSFQAANPAYGATYTNYGLYYPSAGAVLGNLAYFTSGDGYLRNTAYASPISIGSAGCTPAPALANGYVYAAGCDTVGAYSPHNGSTVWTATGFSVIMGLAVAGDLLYVCGDYQMNIFDANYGSLLWSAGQCSTSPVVVNGTVYMSEADVSAYTINGTVQPAIKHAPDPAALRPNLALVAQRTPDQLN